MVIQTSRSYTRTTIPYNLEENGISKRLNRTLLHGTGCTLATAGMPDGYSHFALREVLYK